jgi:hypothetical protein
MTTQSEPADFAKRGNPSESMRVLADGTDLTVNRRLRGSGEILAKVWKTSQFTRLRR